MGGDPETPNSARFVAASDPNLERRFRDSLQALKRPVDPRALQASADVAPQPRAADRTGSIQRNGRTIRVVGAYQELQ